MRFAVALSLCLVGVAGCGLLPPPKPTNYIVFFAPGRAELSPEARGIIRRASGDAVFMRSKTVMVATGISGGNASVADPRFNAIQKALVEDGVSAAVIARGTLANQIENVSATALQRAEITLYPRD